MLYLSSVLRYAQIDDENGKVKSYSVAFIFQLLRCYLLVFSHFLIFFTLFSASSLF